MKYEGKKVGILGFGRSGKACTRVLLREGAVVFVSESSGIMEEEFDVFKKGAEKGLNISRLDGEFRGHTDKLLEQDLIIVSPGISLSLPVLEKARTKGLRVIGELEFGYERFKEKGLYKSEIIGVTGTNGKTTTVHLINGILKHSGINNIACGNLGIPFTEVADMAELSTVPVIEISSFQLEGIDKFKPKIGVFLNATPDHLNRYKDFESYVEAKLRLFKNQDEEDFAILNAQDSGLRSKVESGFFKASKKYFSSSVKKDFFRPDIWVEKGKILYGNKGEVKSFDKKELNVKWDCFIEDYLASILVIEMLRRGTFPEISDEHIIGGLSSFKGVPHRMEEVGEFNGIRVINNSMCTNPDSFIKVIRSLSKVKGSVILIAGGKDKEVPIDGMAEAINAMVKHCVLIGDSAWRLKEHIKISYDYAGDMKGAVEMAFREARAGEIVILSPGFASFDWYNNYEVRGEDFKKKVSEYFKSKD